LILILSCTSQPDAVQRALVGTIISRFEQRGFKLIALKLVHASTEHLEKRPLFSLDYPHLILSHHHLFFFYFIDHRL
jgi:Nucleoside diphosphate kinase